LNEVSFQDLLLKPRKGEYFHIFIIDFQTIAINKKYKNDFLRGFFSINDKIPLNERD